MTHRSLSKTVTIDGDSRIVSYSADCETYQGFMGEARQAFAAVEMGLELPVFHATKTEYACCNGCGALDGQRHNPHCQLVRMRYAT